MLAEKTSQLSTKSAEKGGEKVYSDSVDKHVFIPHYSSTHNQSLNQFSSRSALNVFISSDSSFCLPFVTQSSSRLELTGILEFLLP